jgi:Tat protein translocase TatB subunit
MFDIGLPELLVILLLALIVLGPEELPSFAVRVGRTVYQFRRQYDEIVGQIRAELERAQHELDNATSGLGLSAGALGAHRAPQLHASTLGPLAGAPLPPPPRLSLPSTLLCAVRGHLPPLPADVPEAAQMRPAEAISPEVGTLVCRDQTSFRPEPATAAA